jgi:hypothetical protein
MATFFDFFDDLGAESPEVARIAGRYHALVDNDLRIFPFPAGVDHVRFDRLERGQLATFGDAGFPTNQD